MEKILLLDLIDKAVAILNGFNLATSTLKSYRTRAFKPIQNFFFSRNEYFYDDSLIEKLKVVYFQDYNDFKLSRKSYNWRLRGVFMITEIFETGSFYWKVYSHSKRILLNDDFEEILSEFLMSLDNLCIKSRVKYESILRRFLRYLTLNGCLELKGLNNTLIKNFLKEISATRLKSMDDVVTALKKFLKYFRDRTAIPNSLFLLLTAPRARDKKVYPSITIDEFNKIISAIDTKSVSGKRDYAILLLVATSGLRPGDIANLNLADINWSSSEITLIQGKTKETLILPLVPMTMNAIADYILSERPPSTSKKVFLRSYAPCNGLNDGVSIACIFRKYLKAAGLIHLPGDGKTISGLRRMLATELIKSGTPITTASQVLGHKSKGVIKRYIALDIEGLNECTLGFDSLEVHK